MRCIARTWLHSTHFVQDSGTLLHGKGHILERELVVRSRSATL